MDKNSLATARGIGIIAVVLGHIHVPFPAVPPQMYHMALFFFLGGVGISATRGWRETGQYLFVKFVLFAVIINAIYLMISYIVLMAFDIEYFSKESSVVSLLTTELVTANGHAVSLALTNWFLIAFAMAYVHTFILVKIFSKYKLSLWFFLILGLVLCFVGVELGASKGINDDWVRNQLSHVASASGLMLIGFVTLQTGLIECLKTSPKIFFIATFVLILTWTILKPKTPVMAWSMYPSGGVAFYAVALSAIMIILSVSAWLSKTPIAHSLVYLGTNSKWIMAHHIFGFALVNIALVLMRFIVPEEVEALTFYNRAYLWPIYAIFGFGFPLLLSLCFEGRFKRVA